MRKLLPTHKPQATRKERLKGISISLLLLVLILSQFHTIAQTYNTRGGIGVQWNYATPELFDKAATDVKNSGVAWVRIDCKWNNAQPTSTSWNWTITDNRVNAALSKGLKVLLLPSYSPGWANGGHSSEAAYPIDVPAWKNFLDSIARRYLPKGVTAYEIWNEPNTSPTKSSANYTKNILIPGAEAIRAVSLELKIPVTIVSGAPASVIRDGTEDEFAWYESVYANGGKEAFDAVGIHPYCWPLDPYTTGNPHNHLLRADGIHAIMSHYGDGNKQVWATEFGYPTSSDASLNWVTEEQQAEYLKKAFELWCQPAWQSWTGPFFWYVYRNGDNRPTDRESNFGLLRWDHSFKPAMDTLPKVMLRVPPAPSVPTSGYDPNGIPVTGVDIIPPVALLGAGTSTRLVATVSPSNAANQNVKWRSSNPAVVTVDVEGVVRAISPGFATITVTTQDGGKTASSEITVSNLNGNQFINGFEDASVWKGESKRNENADPRTEGMQSIKVEYSVTQNGWSNAYYTIDSPYVNLSTATHIKIDVYPLSQTPAGKNEPVNFKLSDYTAGVIYDKQLPNIIANQWNTVIIDLAEIPAINRQRISEVNLYLWSGFVSEINGRNKVKYRYDNLRSIVQEVPVEAVTVSPASTSLVVGVTKNLTATVLPWNATIKTVTWSSSDTTVVVVDSLGVMTGVSVGTATITVTSHEGNKTATSSITVYPVNGDKIINGFENIAEWAGQTTRVSNITEKTEGTQSMRNTYVVPASGWSNAFFTISDPYLDLSAATSVKLDIYPLSQTPSSRSEPLNFKITDQIGGVIYEKRVPNLTANQWNTVTISLLSIPADNRKNIREINVYLWSGFVNEINGRTEIAYYFDNLRSTVNASAREGRPIEEVLSDRAISVYPNPVNANILNVSVYSDREVNAVISLTASSSQETFKINTTLKKGDNSIQIPIHGAPNGLHLLTINKGYERIVRKVVVQK